MPDRAGLVGATRGRASSAPQIEDRTFLLCGLFWAAGLIHVAAAVAHRAHVAEAVFFELLAVVQFAFGLALYRSPKRRLLLAGAALNLLVVALWLVSRTLGLPFGPTPWTPEAVGAADVLASADELAIALIVALPAGPQRAGRRLLSVAPRAAQAAGVVLILASSLVLLGGHAH